MNLAAIAGALAWVAVAVIAAMFAGDACREREWRALGVSAGIGGALLAALTAALLAALGGTAGPLWVLLAALGAVAAVVILPVGRTTPVTIPGSPRRVDERDHPFSRFLRLEPGTPDYEAYYGDHPERRDPDAAIRDLPMLGMPGSSSHDPWTSPMMLALSDVTADLCRELDGPPEPLTGQPLDADPAEASRRLAGFARYLGADDVGFCALNPAWIYSHVGRSPGPWGEPIELRHRHAIAIAVAMDHEMVRQAPRAPTLTETTRQYLRAAHVAATLARTIRLWGHDARAHVDGNYRVLCVPVAADAGLGELGRLGLLIHPRLGPRLRLAVVTTDLPLAPSPRRTFGVQEFCAICRKCSDCCPSKSIDPGPRREVNGIDRWVSEQDSCFAYWRRCGTDCAVCVKVCPYSHPATPSHDLVRWAIRRSAVARQLSLWGDDLAYGRRPRRRFPMPEWHVRGQI